MRDFTDKDLEQIEIVIEDRNEHEAREWLRELHPADVAELFRKLDIRQAEWLFNLIEDNEKKADVLMELDEEDRKKLLEDMEPEQIGHFIDLLDTDDAVDLIQELDKEDREEVMQHIDDVEQAGDIVDLLQYDEDTAGGLMGTEMIMVNENLSMPDCLKEMRRQAEDLDDIYYVYVIDNDNRLRGILPLKKMITHPSVSKIKHVMEADPVSVRTDTPIEDVAKDFEKYDLVAMPVIDSIGRLVGQITVDDVMDEVREQSERDYQLASGISSDIDASDSVLAQTKARLPWLLIGIAGGIINSLILGGFEAQIAAVTCLAIFIPLIGGTGLRNRSAGPCQRQPRHPQRLAPDRARVARGKPQRHRHLRARARIRHAHAARPGEICRGGCSRRLPLLRRDFRHSVRHIRAPYPRETENQPGSRHRPLHPDHQRCGGTAHLRGHVDLDDERLRAPVTLRHTNYSTTPFKTT